MNLNIGMALRLSNIWNLILDLQTANTLKWELTLNMLTPNLVQHALP